MTDSLLIATILLLSGVIAVPLAAKLGLSSVLGYLMAGIAISPILDLLHVNITSLQHFAEFGVVMMLFLVGLELEPHKLWSMRQRLMGLGGLQVVGTSLIVMIIAMSLGQAWSVSLAIGLILALSSTAIVLQTLSEKNLMNAEGGRSSFSILLFQDMAVIPILAFIPLLALPELVNQASGAIEQASHDVNLLAGLPSWQVAILTILAIAAVLFMGMFLTRPLFKFIALAGQRELFTAAALMLVVGIALLMLTVGLSPALGTFLAGVVLANSEYRHELEANISPFKGMLLGLFFITVGANIDFQLLSSNMLLVISLTLGLMLIKGLVLLILSYVFKIEGSDRWLMAVALAQAGEFGFVLISFTVSNHVLPPEIASILMLVVALSMLLTPLCFIAYEFVNKRSFKGEERDADKIDELNDIIVIGHGRVGGVVNRMISATGLTTTVIDYSVQQLENLRKFGLKAFYGDGRSPDLLHAAGIEKAKIIIIAIDEKHYATEIARYVISNYPHVHVIARAADRFHVFDLWGVGCRDIIRETYDASMRLGRSVFEAIGYSRENAELIVEEFKERDRSLMLETANLHRPDINPVENEELIAKVREMNEIWKKDLIGKGIQKG